MTAQIILADELPMGKPHRLTYRADEADLAIIRDRLHLDSVSAFSAEIQLLRRRDDSVLVTGSLLADLDQLCVRTLVPVAQHIDDDFRLILVGDPEEADRATLDPKADETDLLEEGRIDIGEIVLQSLSLALNPYPVAPGSGTTQHSTDPQDELVNSSQQPTSPFSVLKKMHERP